MRSVTPEDFDDALDLLEQAVGWFDQVASGGVWGLECEIYAFMAKHGRLKESKAVLTNPKIDVDGR